MAWLCSLTLLTLTLTHPSPFAVRAQSMEYQLPSCLVRPVVRLRRQSGSGLGLGTRAVRLLSQQPTSLRVRPGLPSLLGHGRRRQCSLCASQHEKPTLQGQQLERRRLGPHRHAFSRPCSFRLGAPCRHGWIHSTVDAVCICFALLCTCGSYVLCCVVDSTVDPLYQVLLYCSNGNGSINVLPRGIV